MAQRHGHHRVMRSMRSSWREKPVAVFILQGNPYFIDKDNQFLFFNQFN